MNKNHQHIEIEFIRCKNCTLECEILYDQHYDQYYSNTCGKVLMQSNQYQVPYYTDPHYWEKLIQRRQKVRTLKEILKKLKEENKKHTKEQYNKIDLKITINDKLSKKTKTLLHNKCTSIEYALQEKNKQEYIIEPLKEIKKENEDTAEHFQQ